MRTAQILTLTAILAAASGCKKSEEEAESTSEKKAERDDGGLSKVAAVDPKLAEAFAASSAAPGGPGAPAEGGPPANGIFAPGAADKEIPKGAAPKITLGNEGSTPR